MIRTTRRPRKPRTAPPATVSAARFPDLPTGEATLDALNCPELLISSRDEHLLQLAQQHSCWNDHRGDMSEAYHGGKLRCYVHTVDEGLCYRVNTLAAYMEANRLVSVLVVL